MATDKIKVAVRVRPFNRRGKNIYGPSDGTRLLLAADCWNVPLVHDKGLGLTEKRNWIERKSQNTVDYFVFLFTRHPLHLVSPSEAPCNLGQRGGHGVRSRWDKCLYWCQCLVGIRFYSFGPSIMFWPCSGNPPNEYIGITYRHWSRGAPPLNAWIFDGIDGLSFNR